MMHDTNEHLSQYRIHKCYKSIGLFAFFYNVMSPLPFQKLWDDLKSLIVAIRDSTEIDFHLKESLYTWGLNYV